MKRSVERKGEKINDGKVYSALTRCVNKMYAMDD